MKNKINLLSYNICNLEGCNCGANISLGGSKEIIGEIFNFIAENYDIEDLRNKHKVRKRTNA